MGISLRPEVFRWECDECGAVVDVVGRERPLSWVSGGVVPPGGPVVMVVACSMRHWLQRAESLVAGDPPEKSCTCGHPDCGAC